MLLVQCSAFKLSRAIDNTYTEDLGDIEESGLREIINRIENKYQYQIERHDTYGSGEAHVRTYWKRQPAFTNNQSVNTTEVETRLIFRTRLRNSQGYRLFSVKFTGEYRANNPNNSGQNSFQKSPLTPEAYDYFQEIANDLSDQVSGRIRGY